MRSLISAQRLERSDNPGFAIEIRRETLKAFANCRTLSGFDGFPVEVPRVLAMLEPWAPISQRLRRNFKLCHYFLITKLDRDRIVCLSWGARCVRRILVTQHSCWESTNKGKRVCFVAQGSDGR